LSNLIFKETRVSILIRKQKIYYEVIPALDSFNHPSLQEANFNQPSMSSYSLSIDNLNISVTPSMYSKEKQSKNIEVTCVLALKNRIPFPMEHTKDGMSRKYADEIVVSKFIPTESEIKLVKAAHKHLIKNMLVATLKRYSRFHGSLKLKTGNCNQNIPDF